jgi:lipopolysaccharide transport system ATP-binding protein
MSAQLLGYSVADIDRLMPEIIAFAEIGDYINEPVRVYSSGMQMRLAFSVATAHRPDVLIIDEALSVGDAYFQHKSFERIRTYRALGTTLLIVSHDKAAIQAVCDRAILLNNGEIAFEGPPEAVMDYYNALLGDPDGTYIHIAHTPDGKIQTRSGSACAVIESVTLADTDGLNLEQVSVGQLVYVHVAAHIHAFTESLVMGYQIKDRLGQIIYGTNTHFLKQTLHHLQPDQRVNFRIGFAANLGEGSYSITVALHESENHIRHNYDWLDQAVVFQVINSNKENFVGCAWLPPTFEIDQ